MLIHYLKLAWRNLSRHRMYATINIAGLAIGLASVVLITLYVRDEVSFDRFHANGPQIYRVVHDAMSPEGQEEKGGNTGAMQAAAFKTGIPEIENVCRVRGGWEELVKKGDDAISESVLYADTSFFSMFSFALMKGDPLTALKDQTNVVLSEDMARKYFGSTDVIGKEIEINQDGAFSRFRVSAVAANTPVNSSIRFEILLPIEKSMQADWTKRWMNNFLNTFIQLRKDAALPAVIRKMNVILEQRAGEQLAEIRKKYPNVYYQYNLQAFQRLHLDKTYNAGNGLTDWSNSSYSYILGLIALFILITASINFVNLSLSRSLKRAKEVGIRKVSGSSRPQLVAQYMSESLLLNLLSMIPAILIVVLVLPFFNQIAQKQLSFSMILTPGAGISIVSLIIINTVLSGFYPALFLSGFNPVQTLYGRIRLNTRNYLSRSLVVLQFAMGVFLITGTIVMQRQFNYMLHKDPGYTTENLVSIAIPWGKEANLQSFKTSLTSFPSILEAGAQSNRITAMNTTSVQIDKKEFFNVPYYGMDAAVLPMLKIPFALGNNFTGLPSDTNKCIVNESMVRAAALAQPIGKKLHWNERELTIIGVVKDFHTASFHEKIAPTLIQQEPNQSYSTLTVKIDGTQKAKSIQTIQQEFRKFFPFYPCDYIFLTDEIAQQYATEERWKTIVGFAAFLSVLVCCMGLFGLAALQIAGRTKEIGIRKVLGAGIPGIVQLVSRDFIKLVFVAILIGAPVAWYFSNKWLQDFAFRIPLTAWIIVLSGSIALTISIVTVSFQAIKAALSNPVTSLRSE
jgi:putative ABC transport system permease protein